MSQIFKRPPAVPVPKIRPSGWRLPAGEKKEGNRNRENEGKGGREEEREKKKERKKEKE